MKEAITVKEEGLVIKEKVPIIEQEVEGMVKEVNSHSLQKEGQEVISIIIPINKVLIRWNTMLQLSQVWPL